MSTPGRLMSASLTLVIRSLLAMVFELEKGAVFLVHSWKISTGSSRDVANFKPLFVASGDGKCVVCDSYVRPCTLVRVCDECNYGSYQGRCVICGGLGISDAYYCKECTQQEKDVSLLTYYPPLDTFCACRKLAESPSGRLLSGSCGAKLFLKVVFEYVTESFVCIRPSASLAG